MATVAMGTVLMKGTTAIASLTAIDGLKVTSETVDTTAMDTIGGYRTFVATLKDAGEVTLSGHYTYEAHGQFLTDFEAQTVDTYSIQFPDKGPTGQGTTWTFSGVITTFNTTAAGIADLVGFESIIKVSGKPTLAGPA